ncbi:hypothetical protein KAF25_009209 [Fusarium avenaceum]|uniref:Zn(2)-C6 fungal-type domain-containing protein n=1 Tax=Fusarium avenaceum TaxID=40199 RepID=A0A9P7GXK3_9HYPO|nr:hypothetical protein KAF25_009209 [Fusarium avenaceum]
MDSIPRLRCEECKRRKRRCDKKSPCSPCQDAGLTCNAVQRLRLPRGRSGKTSAEPPQLELRVARLENLLNTHRMELASQAPVIQSTPLSLPEGTSSNVVAHDFWKSLNEEVKGLRDILQAEDEDPDEPDDTSPEVSDKQPGPEGILFGHEPLHLDTYPSKKMHDALLDLYSQRVACIYRVLHWPTALADLEDSYNQHHDVGSQVAICCLRHAIYFMAICTITDPESEHMFLRSRPSLLQGYRQATEELLRRASFICRPSIIVLQAFVIYLMGLRTCDTGVSSWSLVALAVRIADALRLGDEDPGEFSLFDLEIRRRLLFAIGLLDSYSSLDRGTLPIMSGAKFSQRPCIVNDTDIWPQCTSVVPSPIPLDMAFSEILYESVILHRNIIAMTCNAQVDWSVGLALVQNFESLTQEKYSRIRETDAPILRLLKIAARQIAVSMHLLLRRPPYRQVPKKVPEDGFKIVEVAASVLQAHMAPKDPALVQWNWKSWPKWHALAVVLAELCARPPGPEFDEFFPVAIEAFRKFAGEVADGKSGRIWKPMARLLKMAEQRKQAKANSKQVVLSPELGTSAATPEITNPDAAGFTLCGLDLTTSLDQITMSDIPISYQYDNDLDVYYPTPWDSWENTVQDMYFTDYMDTHTDHNTI